MSKKDFKTYGCIVVVVLSHGHKDETIYAYDGSFNLNNTLVHPIAKNLSLFGKPKIFIIAACRGDQHSLASGERVEKDAVPFWDESETLPYIRDILKCYSTYEGTYFIFN